MKNLILNIENEMQIKYRYICEIYTCTKNLIEALSCDDRVSSKMALSERAQFMDLLSDLDKRIYQITKPLDVKTRNDIMTLMKGGIKESGLSKDENFKTVIELIEKTLIIWKRTVEIDSSVSKRLMGKDSFYAQK